MRPAIFLDRDGTLIAEGEGFITSPDQIELYDGAAEAVARFHDAGFVVPLITNQSAIARGLIDELQLERIHQRLIELLAAKGTRLDGIYYCPHHPEGEVNAYSIPCECRKPGDGLLRTAIAALDIDPRRSFLIGDDLRDLEATRHLGVTPVLVRTGKGRRREAEARVMFGPELCVVDDLQSAANWIQDTLGGSFPDP